MQLHKLSSIVLFRFLSYRNVHKELFLDLRAPSKHLCADVSGKLVFGVLPMTFGWRVEPVDDSAILCFIFDRIFFFINDIRRLFFSIIIVKQMRRLFKYF